MILIPGIARPNVGVLAYTIKPLCMRNDRGGVKVGRKVRKQIMN